jgi:hypothetical protein
MDLSSRVEFMTFYSFVTFGNSIESLKGVFLESSIIEEKG